MSIRRSSRSARRRRLPALVALVTFVAAVTDAAPVLAGMDTIVHFTNLSPYTATGW
jgi:hypothetical protein